MSDKDPTIKLTELLTTFVGVRLVPTETLKYQARKAMDGTTVDWRFIEQAVRDHAEDIAIKLINDVYNLVGDK